MASNEPNKEPDFYPFRLKEHGWVLKKGIPIEEIGEAYRDLVYQLVAKDFVKDSVASRMYEDALAMMKARSDKARKAAETRWNTEESPPRKSKPEPMPKAKNLVINWAIDNGIDPDDAGECWEATMERQGKDGNGNTIQNWKSFVASWCKTRKENRK